MNSLAKFGLQGKIENREISQDDASQPKNRAQDGDESHMSIVLCFKNINKLIIMSDYLVFRLLHGIRYGRAFL